MKPADFEKIIIKTLFINENVRNKILPMLSTKWFFDIDTKSIVSKVIDFNGKYGQMPNVIEMKRLISDDSLLGVFESAMEIPDEEVGTEFILDEIEEYVRRRLVYNVAETATKYVMGQELQTGDKEDTESLADRMSDAETFTFNTDIGFDMFNDPRRLFEDANTKEVIFRSGVKTIDDIIGGGFHEKSLNIFMAPTNIGKTLIMCSLATNFVLAGLNVLYVTFEDPENKIAARCAQNMFNVTQEEYKHMSQDNFVKAFQQVKSRLKNNRIIIKEYPEGTVNAMKLNSLVKELKDKQNWKPDVVLIDYIGCMIPNGRPNPALNTNTTLQLISLQTRALAMVHGFPIISGMQANRGGNGVSEISLTDVADSFASTTKADAIFGVTQTDEYKQQRVYCVKLLKTRYGGGHRNDVFLVGVDTEKQRIFDVDNQQVRQEAVNIFTSDQAAKSLASSQPDDDAPYAFGSEESFNEIDYD